jgi:transposase, IS5 family
VMTDRRRAATRRAREMAATMRARARMGREEGTQAIGRATGDLADLAEAVAAQAAAVLRNGRRAVRRALSGRVRGRLRRALGELAVTIGRTAVVVAQARSRLAGQMPTARPGWSACTTPTRGRSARAASTGRPGFGYKAQVLDNDDGIVLDYSVECGAVPDGPQLAPAIERVRRRAGRAPRAVTADRGYGQAAVEQHLHAAGVRTVAISRQATTSAARKAIEHGRGFRKLVKWRTGCEGRISYLKRGYGWDRTRLVRQQPFGL